MNRTRITVIVVALLVVGGLGAGLGLAFMGSSGHNGNQAVRVGQTGQLASIQTGCQQWLRAAPEEPGTAQLCRDMTQWMARYMGSSGVGSQMMWGDSGRLGSTCEQWMTESVPAGITDHQSWCNAMVAWMTSHMDRWSGSTDWSHWMMSGPMMGR